MFLDYYWSAHFPDAENFAKGHSRFFPEQWEYG
jgi:hypothetical protein